MEPIISKMPVHVALCALGFWMLKGYGFRRTQAVDVRGSWEEGTKVKSCLWTGLGLCQEDLPPLPTQCTLGCQQQTGGPGAVWTGLFPLQSLLSSNLKIVRIYFIKEGGISLFPIKIRAFLIFFKFFFFLNFILAVQELFCSCNEELLADCNVWASHCGGFSCSEYGL